jgi:predicted esterase
MHAYRAILFALTLPLFCASNVAAATDEFTCASGGARIIETTLGDVPAIVRIPRSITKPPIILWHGFGPPDSERALMDALPLDEVPAVKVYLGLPLFGARMPEGGDAELRRRQTTDFASLLFEPAVMGAANELRAVLKVLEIHDCVKAHDPIGLFGFSAGGAAVLFALAEAQVPVSAAVTLNASTGLTASVNAFGRALKQPFAWTDRSRQLARQSDAPGRAQDIAVGNPPPALLIIHGNEDAMLTPQVASTLHDALLPFYQRAKAKQRLQLELVPGMTHTWADADHIDALRTSIAAWFDRYLTA